MRTVFMGSPEFAVASLEVVHRETELLAVYSQPDKPRGRRGKTLVPTAVKARALELGVPVYEPKRIRDEEVVAQLRELDPDVILVVAYAKLIPTEILELPKWGCINVHPSLLPRYRGAIPLQAAIFNGDRESGVCTFFMDEGYDTGDLIVTRRTPLGEDETATEFSSRMAEMGAEVLLETIDLLRQGNPPRYPQPAEAEGGYTKPLKKEDLQLDWSQPAEAIRNRVRGLADEPGAVTFLPNGEALKVGQARALSDGVSPGQPGEVVDFVKGAGPVVACGSGALVLQRLKPAGKGWMDGASFWNGGRVQVGERLGSPEAAAAKA